MNQEAQALADEIKRLAQQWALAEVRDTDDCATLGESLASAIDRLAAMAQPPAGWVMVPVEPTRAMLDAADKIIDCDPLWVARGYRAMLSAAPKPEEQKECRYLK